MKKLLSLDWITVLGLIAGGLLLFAKLCDRYEDVPVLDFYSELVGGFILIGVTLFFTRFVWRLFKLIVYGVFYTVTQAINDANKQ